jgi:tetratricopeptide (TPR) repeat protein
VAGGLVVVGNVQMATGDFAASRKSYQEALDTQIKIGNVDDAAETKFALADLALAEGNPEKAEPLVRESIAQLEKGQGLLDQIAAYTTLSRILQAKGELEEAMKAADHAAMIAGSNNMGFFHGVNLPLKIEQERVKAASADRKDRGEITSTRQKLNSLIATAHKLGFFNFECDARLALAELEMRTNPQTAHQQLASLAQDAQDHGFVLVTKRASDLAHTVAASLRQAKR